MSSERDDAATIAELRARLRAVEALAVEWAATSSKMAVGIIKQGCAVEVRAALAPAAPPVEHEEFEVASSAEREGGADLVGEQLRRVRELADEWLTDYGDHLGRPRSWWEEQYYGEQLLAALDAAEGRDS